jgi:hypothetical protein
VKNLRVLLLIPIFQFPLVSLAHIAVSASTTILIDSREPEPLQRAATDLASDFKKVFGQAPRIVHSLGDTTSSVIWIVLDRNMPGYIERPDGWERLHIQVVKNLGVKTKLYQAIVLTGSDLRGSIYAIYQFSEQFLGVDPLYWWTDQVPRHRARVYVPDGFSLTSGPNFHYRGWFINDEDLLTGWTPGRSDGTGISLDTWDHVFEAILRLKGNLVVPGTFIFPDELQIRAAGERGLVVTQHHVNTLGLNTHRWPRNQPMAYLSDPKIMESAWRRAVSQYPKETEVLWSIGFRGTDDQPFWADDPAAPSSDKDRAQIIRAAMEKQIEIVRSQRSDPEFFINAWQETGVFIHEGLLEPPRGATLVWADNGHGILEDGGALAQNEGEYYHTAMHDEMSNHYTEMIPLERIQRELGRAAKVGATRVLLINTGNIRPVVMTTRAAMELAWNSSGWSRQNSTANDEYMGRWSREEFGERAAARIAEYYRSYFASSARYGSAEDETAGDNFYPFTARLLIAGLLKRNSAYATMWPNVDKLESYANRLLEICSPADSRWQETRRLAKQAESLVPRERLEFFQGSVLMPVDVHLHFNRMLMNLAQVVRAADVDDKVRLLRTGIAEGDEVVKALHAAEYGKWKNFYTVGDWLLDTQGLIAFARACLDDLEGRPVSEDVISRNEDIMRHFYMAYFRITAYQGKRMVEF